MTSAFANLSTAWPVALLPLRLETRFLGAELCIRVIPDTIHVDSHEPELTDLEVAAARSYWAQAADPDPDTAVAAWRTLAGALGPERAAWAARVVRQTSDARPVPFPPASRPTTWTRPPVARGLPTRWFAVGRLADVTTRGQGTPIIDPLPVGPDPAAGGAAQPAWMRDFGEAEKAGMGLRLPLSPQMQHGGLDLLLVYGVDESGDPVRGAQVLGELLDAHYYTDGFRYVPAGTPTTNTPTASAAYDTRAQAYTDAYRVRAADQPPTDAQSGAVRLGAALGIPLAAASSPPSPSPQWRPHIAAAAQTLAGVGHGDATQNWLTAQSAVSAGVASALGLATDADDTEETTARAVNTALWAAGPGYFLSQMLIGTQGDDFRRLDHDNVIAADAYLRYADRQRLLLAAEIGVIAQETQLTGLTPQTADFDFAWQAAVDHRAASRSISTDQAAQELTAEITVRAADAWQQLRPGDRFDPTGDWTGAARDLDHDRAARYAYFRWLARSGRSPQPDLRLDDWLAGETAALYGDATMRAARAHFVDHVRPGGALPAIAVGDQPYGVLVTTALDDWQPVPGEERLRAFVQALLVLRDTVWTPCVPAVPQVGPEPAPDARTALRTLLALLATGPISGQVFARETIGPDYVRNLWRFTQAQLDADWDQMTAASSTELLHDLGIAWTPRLSGLVGAEASVALTAPLVDDGSGAHPQWLAWLAAPSTTLDAIRAQVDRPGPAGTTPLLYRLLRHAALREYVTAAVRLQLRAGILGDGEHLEQELVNIRPGPAVATVWEQLERRVALPDGSHAVIASYLDGPSSADDPAAADLMAFRAAVDTLARGAAAEELERNLRLMLDSTSHRLDAWITSLGHRRLAAIRAATPSGTLLGGYGWVEDLRPRSAAPSSDGFLHAPSVPQAVTAAVLRSGYQSYGGGATNPFAIDLASHRVQMAARLLDGVRAGQTVGALTGYDFERALQSSGAGRYTRPFRECAPPSTTTYPAGNGPPDSRAQPPALTDGLVLRDRWRSNDPQVTALLAQIAADDVQRQQAGEAALAPVVSGLLAALDDALDAAGDALIAESVHHVINGASSRAAATLDHLARGDGTVPELDLLTSPVSGSTVAHRVVIAVAASSDRRPGWAAPGPQQLRAAADPTLEALAQTWLPDPRTVRCAVTATTAATAIVRLSDAQLGALDCLYETPAAAAPSALDAVPDGIVLAVVEAARRLLGIDAAPTVTVTWDRTADFAPGELTFGDLCGVSRLARAVVQAARALRPADLAPLGTADAAVVDAAIGPRADAAEAAVRAAAAGVRTDTPAQAIRIAASIGVRGAAQAATDPDPRLVAAVGAELDKRVALLDRLADAAAGVRDVGRLQAAFGPDFLPLPAFTPAGGADLQGSAASSRNPAPRTLRSWLLRYGQVRPGVGALVRLRTATSALVRDPGELSTVQLPSVDGEAWVGGPFDGAPPAGPRVQIAVAGGALPPPDTPLAGLLVDEWTETVPDRTALTALAYHYASPLSEPPQAVLLAVPADPTAGSWTPDALERILAESLALAKLRAVDQDALARTGQLLPAFYLANNVSGETVSTDVYATTTGTRS